MLDDGFLHIPQHLLNGFADFTVNTNGFANIISLFVSHVAVVASGSGSQHEIKLSFLSFKLPTFNRKNNGGHLWCMWFPSPNCQASNGSQLHRCYFLVLTHESQSRQQPCNPWESQGLSIRPAACCTLWCSLSNIMLHAATVLAHTVLSSSHANAAIFTWLVRVVIY